MRSLFAVAAAAVLLGSAHAAEKTCSRHGTTIDFMATPKEAAAEAKRVEKLVLVLHISGHFEDPGLT